MRVSDFHFDLPGELIAQHPPAIRGSSRLLVLDRSSGALTDAMFSNLPELLQPGDLLILNDSRVLPARLFATRAGARTQHNSPRPSGLIEVLLTEQLGASPDGSAGNRWRALVKPARKVVPGEVLHFADPVSRVSPATPVLRAEVLAAGEYGERTLRFDATAQESFYDALHRIGHMPLPPYIHREQSGAPDSAEDRERYQTVYSQRPESQVPGSAAAPTAGLHFTTEILDRLRARGVEIQTLTLHVGLGTFQPVRVSELKDIRLHAEAYTLPAATAQAINRALVDGRRIVAVGTTTTRTLEHIAATLLGGPSFPASSERVGSNEPRLPIPSLQPHAGSTSIFLQPGHRFRIVSGLLTNFHLPESTLLMLVAAFADPSRPERGREAILAAYAHAIRQRYRFYSYGDCMLLV